MWVLDFLAPQSCVFCGLSSAGEEKSICTGCYADLPWNEPAISPEHRIFDCCIAMLLYSFPVDVAIKAFKFERKLYYAPAFTEILCAACPLLPQDIDAVLPVPLHWQRKAWRGFNQASELAKPVAKALGVPVIRGVYRRKATPYQSGLAARERVRNLRSAFEAKVKIANTHILIIDDVITTGATSRALARVLLASGALKVSSLSIARAGLSSVSSSGRTQVRSVTDVDDFSTGQA